MKFDHIGVFVADIPEGDALISSMIPIATRSEIYADPLINVQVQFLFDSTGICYELVAPLGAGNPVDGVLKSRRNVLNHVAYRTSNFDADLRRLRADGAFQLNEPKPAVAFRGKRVVFLMTSLNFILELVEE